MFQILETNPTYNQPDVLISTRDIIFTFNEDIDPATVSDLTVSGGIHDSSPFQSLPGTVIVSDRNQITFRSSVDLAYGTRYVFIVTGGSFGVKSVRGRTLDSDFLLYFDTEAAAAGGDTGGGTTPPEDPTSGIPLEIPTIAPTSVVAVNGQLILTYADPVPNETTVTVSSRHPLGRLGGIDLWRDGVSYAISGNTITLSCPESNYPLTYADRIVDTSQEYYQLLSNSIPVVSFSVNETDIVAVMDLAVNRLYTLTVNHPDGTHIVKYQTHMGPQLMAVEEANFLLGPLATVFESDDELRLSLYVASEEAYSLWVGSGHRWPEYAPYYAIKYVFVRITLMAMDLRYRRSVAVGEADSFTLGDLKVSTSSDTGSADLETTVTVEELKRLRYILGRKLRAGDTASLPITQPLTSLLTEHPSDAVIASAPIRGRVSPQYDPQWDRSINRRPDARRGLGRRELF